LSKNKTIRFAFGTPTDPGSSVWRVIITKKPGDIYLNNSPIMGDAVHISLHISGKFHFKLGENDKYILEPPYEMHKGVYFGPILFFYPDRRIYSPMPASGKIDKIFWIGWPEENHYIQVKFLYSERDLRAEIRPNERLLSDPFLVNLQGKRMNFYILAEYMKMSEEYIAERKSNPPQTIEFKDGIPDGVEMIRVTKNSDGPSLIIINPFNAIRL
jgi:hypothetical protein